MSFQSDHFAPAIPWKRLPAPPCCNIRATLIRQASPHRTKGVGRMRADCRKRLFRNCISPPVCHADPRRTAQWNAMWDMILAMLRGWEIYFAFVRINFQTAEHGMIHATPPDSPPFFSHSFNDHWSLGHACTPAPENGASHQSCLTSRSETCLSPSVRQIGSTLLKNSRPPRTASELSIPDARFSVHQEIPSRIPDASTSQSGYQPTSIRSNIPHPHTGSSPPGVIACAPKT